MSKLAVAVVVLLALVLGGVYYFGMRPTQDPADPAVVGVPIGDRVLGLDASQIAAVRIEDGTSGTTQYLTRGAAGRWVWSATQRTATDTGWPIIGERVRGFIRTLAALECVATPPADHTFNPQSTVTIVALTESGTEHAIVCDTAAIAGRLIARVGGGSEAPLAMIESSIINAVQAPGPQAWRIREPFAEIAIQPRAIVVQLTADQEVRVAKNDSGWWMEKPYVHRVDTDAVDGLLTALSGAMIQDFQDAQNASGMNAVDLTTPSWKGPTVRVEPASTVPGSTAVTLTITGDSLNGRTVRAELTPPGKEVQMDAATLRGVRFDPLAALSRIVTRSEPGRIGGFEIKPATQDSAAPTFRRIGETWHTRSTAGVETAASAEDAQGVAALLTILTQQRASAIEVGEVDPQATIRVLTEGMSPLEEIGVVVASDSTVILTHHGLMWIYPRASVPSFLIERVLQDTSGAGGSTNPAATDPDAQDGEIIYEK